jgi:hypothetical protein
MAGYDHHSYGVGNSLWFGAANQIADRTCYIANPASNANGDE